MNSCRVWTPHFSMAPTPRFAAVELGGTSIRVAIAEGECSNIVARESFVTGDPVETLARVHAWLSCHKFDALGVASFGPIEPRRGRAKYGFITTTPKPGWQDVDVLGMLRAADFGVPVAFDTDVNAPAVAEFRAARSSAPQLTSCAYMTVGTGIGVGLVINGAPVHGMLHPEAGHCPAPAPPGDSWRNTLGHLIPSGIEANVCAPALAARAGVAQSELAALPDSHPVWDQCAHYLAVLCVDLTLITSVERIVIGGGVPARASLLPRVRAKFLELLNGYLRLDELTPERVDEYIVAPANGADAGLVGALTLARDAAEERAGHGKVGLTPTATRSLAAGAVAMAGACLAFAVGLLVGRRASSLAAA